MILICYALAKYAVKLPKKEVKLAQQKYPPYNLFHPPLSIAVTDNVFFIRQTDKQTNASSRVP